MFSYSVFEQGEDTLLAIADNSVLGRILEDDEIRMVVSESFYGAKKCDKNKLKTLIKTATIINAVGKESVSLLVSEKVADEKNILFIAGVPHVQIINIL